jgi:hypothetical protein
MELKDLIQQTAKERHITVEQLFNKDDHTFTPARRELCYLAKMNGFTYADLEKASGITASAWRKTFIVFQKTGYAHTYEQRKKEEERVNKATKKAQVPSLGFRFSIADEIRMDYSINAAIEFMKNYGKGYQPTTSYGRIISDTRAYQM